MTPEVRPLSPGKERASARGGHRGVGGIAVRLRKFITVHGVLKLWRIEP